MKLNKLSRQELKSAIIGMVIGDGCLSKKIKNDKNNAYFQMKHCAKQYDYMLWKQKIINQLTKSVITPNNSSGGFSKDKIYEGYHLGSRVHPQLTALYNRFYMYEKKSLDEYLLKMITPLALAIIYMDDGTLGAAYPEYWVKEAFFLRLCNFDYANLFLLKKSLKIKFDLDWNINRHSAGKNNKKIYYQLRLLTKHNQMFVDIVKPYIETVPSMLYKLGSYASTSHRDVVTV